MAKFRMPFLPEWKEKMLNDRKTCTSRVTRYCREGDEFEAFEREFVVTTIYQVNLDFVSCILFRQEGCSSPQAFIDIWNRIHPKKRFIPMQLVWVHWFKPKFVRNDRPIIEEIQGLFQF